ncbi:MAG: hypothetical protein RLZZ297_3 [Chloroflexota bacterium]|jgi:uncharacterized membrane protein
MRRTQWHLLTVIVIVVVIGFIAWAYPQLPERVPSHWNIRGEIDGYSDPLTASLLFPGLVVLVSGLMAVFSWKERNTAVADALAQMSTVMAVFLGCLHVIITLAALGYGFTVERWIAGLLGVLFAVISRQLVDVPQNGFIGFRTYWTLANPTVWTETHRLAARWMAAGGIVIIVLALLPLPAEWLFGGMLAAIVVAVAYPMWYAYRRFHELTV